MIIHAGHDAFIGSCNFILVLLVSSIVFKFMFYLIFKSTLLFYNLIMGMPQNQSNKGLIGESI
jgi:hypothetical protein